MEENAQITGFHTITSNKPINFTEINTSELERILNSFILSSEFVAIKKFFNDLEAHIHTPYGHELNMHEFKDALIRQLFDIYVQSGYSGEYKDMLNAIIKDIKVATDAIAKVGVSTSEAITAQQFKKFYQDHVLSLGSHYKLFQQFRIGANWNIMPDIFFTKDFKQDYDAFIEDGYTITEWNPTRGTIVLDFLYDTNIPYNLLDFYFEDPVVVNNVITTKRGLIEIRAVPADDLFYIVEKVENESANTNIVPMVFDARKARERYIITYDLSGTYVRNYTHMEKIEYNPFYHNVTSMKFRQELGGTIPAAIQEFAYYHNAANETEAVFLLN